MDCAERSESKRSCDIVSSGLLLLLLTLGGLAHADTWHPGDLTTYNQGSWGGCTPISPPSIDCDPSFPDPGATLLVANFNSVYASTGGVIVGSASGFTMVFTDASSVLRYQPSIGPFAPLSGSVVDPLSTASGAFGGEVLALQFNVDFSDAGLLPGTSGIPFGDLVLSNLSFSAQPVLNGLTIRQFLADENILLSGGSTVLSIADLGTLPSDVNSSFSNGIPSAFAQAHLLGPTSTAPVPEPPNWMLVATAVLGLGWKCGHLRQTSLRAILACRWRTRLAGVRANDRAGR